MYPFGALTSVILYIPFGSFCFITPSSPSTFFVSSVKFIPRKFVFDDGVILGAVLPFVNPAGTLFISAIYSIVNSTPFTFLFPAVFIIFSVP